MSDTDNQKPVHSSTFSNDEQNKNSPASEKNGTLLLLLLIATCLVLFMPNCKKYETVTKVDRATGEVWRGMIDKEGRIHGHCTIHDKNGNLIEEEECEHGVFLFRRKYAPDGTLLLEIREDENFHMIQTYPKQKRP